MNTKQNKTQLIQEEQALLQQWIRPLPTSKAIILFILAGLGFRFSIYNGIPLLIQLGLTAFEAFLVTFTVPLAILFALAFESAKREGVPLTWKQLALRFQLKKIRWQGLLWLIISLIAAVGLSGLLTPTRDLILRWFPMLMPPASFPPILNPTLQNEQLPSTLLAWMGEGAQANWGYAILIIMLFFFNMFGEELFWRGIIFPRQLLVHGRYTWIIHGLMWNLFHLPFYPWYLIYGLPITLAISFLMQKTNNTWLALILHAIANLFFYLLMLSVIFG